jgi:hypothetical protein
MTGSDVRKHMRHSSVEQLIERARSERAHFIAGMWVRFSARVGSSLRLVATTGLNPGMRVLQQRAASTSALVR